jgi:hypothetical protein
VDGGGGCGKVSGQLSRKVVWLMGAIHSSES